MTADARRASLSSRATLVALMLSLAAPAGEAIAGAQQYEPLAASVQAALHSAISDERSPEPIFPSQAEKQRWLSQMSARLAKRIPDTDYRTTLLKTIYYEATRAGLDPQLVLGVIQVESNFRKYAVSRSGARGFMQVMPFWVKLIGRPSDDLFHLRTNLRYGCTILRHYLDVENGDLFRALGRYNGSLGQAQYPELVRTAWQRDWAYQPLTVADSGDGR